MLLLPLFLAVPVVFGGEQAPAPSVGELANPMLPVWQNFYIVIGSSDGALIGVQFVVITLIASMRRPATADSIRAFGTPTVVHLASALLVSAIMGVPWPSLFPASIALAVCGLGGLTYGVTVICRARRQTHYKPQWEGWLWYACCRAAFTPASR